MSNELLDNPNELSLTENSLADIIRLSYSHIVVLYSSKCCRVFHRLADTSDILTLLNEQPFLYVDMNAVRYLLCDGQWDLVLKSAQCTEEPEDSALRSHVIVQTDIANRNYMTVQLNTPDLVPPDDLVPLEQMKMTPSSD